MGRIGEPEEVPESRVSGIGSRELCDGCNHSNGRWRGFGNLMEKLGLLPSAVFSGREVACRLQRAHS